MTVAEQSCVSDGLCVGLWGAVEACARRTKTFFSANTKRGCETVCCERVKGAVQILE